MKNKTLIGHVSPETAYVVDDYPYGFTLRCKIRYWIETKPKLGQRLVMQTTNPKKGDIWNKPKFSTYSVIMFMQLDSQNHVVTTAINYGMSGTNIEKWVEQFDQNTFDDYQAFALTKAFRVAKALENVRYEIKSEII